MSNETYKCVYCNKEFDLRAKTKIYNNNKKLNWNELIPLLIKAEEFCCYESYVAYLAAIAGNKLL